MPGFRSGFVAVIGRPNVGKSTLLNRLIGQKVAIVSDKPQTTRNTIQCVLTREDAQIIFLDTPGLHKPVHKLGEYMVKAAYDALEGVDVVLFVIDITDWRKADEHIIRELPPLDDQKLILVANKTDQLNKEKEDTNLETIKAKRRFDQVVSVSALTGDNLDELIDVIVQCLPEGPKYYPDDWITDHPERFVIAEFIREQILISTEDEIPHSVAVEVEEIREEPEKALMTVRATIFVDRDSQKGIVIGKRGAMLKKIGSGARQQIEELLGTKVFLDIWVKVKKDWRNKAGVLRELGYE